MTHRANRMASWVRRGAKACLRVRRSGSLRDTCDGVYQVRDQALGLVNAQVQAGTMELSQVRIPLVDVK